MNAKRKSAESKKPEPTFEDSLDRLETIVHDLEEGRCGLDESLARYEEGVKLLKRCYHLLEAAEHRIEVLSGFDSEGNPVGEPFDEQAGESLESKAQSRSRRRSHRKTSASSDAQVDDGDGLF